MKSTSLKISRGTNINVNFIDVNKLEELADSFVDILKSTSIAKIICIYIAFPIFSVGVKYFSIRWIIISYVIIQPEVCF